MPAKEIAKILSSHLLCVRSDTSLAEAYEILGENEIRHLPVVTDQGLVVGIISDRDFLLAQIPTSSRKGMHQWPPSFAPNAQVRDFMTTELKVISINEDIKEAVNFMINTKISSCLVEKEGMIVGIVTTEDLLVLLKNYLANPSGSLRAKMESFILNSPLGTLAHQLSNAGI